MLSILADTVLLLHFGIVVFVVGGLLAIVVGNLRHWPWVNAPWFRWLHLSAILVVAAESWIGITCPFTTLEGWLRAQAGEVAHPHSFVAYWLRRLLFYEAAPWVFTLAYTAYAGLVMLTWWYWPPRKIERRHQR